MTDQKNQYTRKQGRGGQQPLDFGLAHVMPQAPDMEKAVLGALMIDKDAYLEVCDLLRPESFYEPSNRPPTDGGEIIGSSMNNMPFPPPETPFPNA